MLWFTPYTHELQYFEVQTCGTLKSGVCSTIVTIAVVFIRLVGRSLQHNSHSSHITHLYKERKSKIKALILHEMLHVPLVYTNFYNPGILYPIIMRTKQNLLQNMLSSMPSTLFLLLCTQHVVTQHLDK